MKSFSDISSLHVPVTCGSDLLTLLQAVLCWPCLLLASAEAMGFNRNRAVRGVYHTGGAGVPAAVEWLAEHENDVRHQPLVSQEPSIPCVL